MSSIRAGLSGYFAVWRPSFLEFVAYRSSVLVEFLTYPLAFLGYFFFIQGLFQAGHGPQGYTLPHLMTYFSLAWLLRLVFNQGLDVSMGATIANGQIVHELLKPLDYHLLMFARFAGKGGTRLLLYALPALGLLFLLFGQLLQFNWAHLPRFLVFALLGLWISFELQFLIGSLAFFFTMNYQISWSMDMLIRLASGLIIPLNLFPEALGRVLAFLPFQYLYFIPIQAYLTSMSSGELTWRLLTGVIWAAFLLAINRVLLARALRQLAVFGG